MKHRCFFYLPESHLPEKLPDPSDYTWAHYGYGKYTWVLQTYYRLVQAGIDCSLVHTLPNEGVIISHRACLPDSLIPSRKQILVCIQADWSRHPFAQIHICQNRTQSNLSGVPRLERIAPSKAYFVHHWPQPGMVARKKERGNTFENLVYFGLQENLAPELKREDWQQFLKKLGVNWKIESSRESWKHYENVDAVLFARDFSGKKHINKPASKLYNAWLSGVIPVCTPESAYIDEINDTYDAVVVSDYEALKQAITRLKGDSALRSAMLQRGMENASRYQPLAIAKEWQGILKTVGKYKMGRFQYAYFLAARAFSWVLCNYVRGLYDKTFRPSAYNN